MMTRMMLCVRALFSISLLLQFFKIVELIIHLETKSNHNNDSLVILVFSRSVSVNKNDKYESSFPPQSKRL